MQDREHCKTCSPFWLRLQPIADQWKNAATAGCTVGTVQRIECRTEFGADSQPTQRCQRIIKRYRECPGRPAELLESAVEETTRAAQEADNNPFEPRMDPLQPNVGEAVEEFMRMAAEISRSLDNDVASVEDRGVLNNNSQQELRGRFDVFMRMFGLGSRRKPGDGGSKEDHDKLWEEYASKFEEV